MASKHENDMVMDKSVEEREDGYLILYFFNGKLTLDSDSF